MLLAWCPSAFALDPTLDINQYAHTAWRIRDGFAKGRINAIAQTPDGYLWVGTDAMRPPHASRLLRDRDGGLWIASSRGGGGLGHVHQGITDLADDRFTPVRGLPGGLTRGIVEDNRGTLWIANRDFGLFHVSADAAQVEQIPWAEVRQTGIVTALVADPSHGGLWLGFSDGGIV